MPAPIFGDDGLDGREKCRTASGAQAEPGRPHPAAWRDELVFSRTSGVLPGSHRGRTEVTGILGPIKFAVLPAVIAEL